MNLLIFVLFSTFASFSNAGPIVNVKYGKIEGFEHTSPTGHVSEVFLAVPFAKPPIGDLRFERPEEPEHWEDVYQATQFRNDCTPHYSLVATFSHYSGEDCLTLNIIKPKTVSGKLPVLFWVHGGGYSIGSASQHGYQVFADKYVPKGVIVVTIQYRLGFMGFFTQGKSGNMGLFDQAAALRFVHENIDNFGGDKCKITIWGYSAGGASVSQLTISPYTRDLYDKAIVMSASSYAGWATGAEIENHSKELAEALNCDWNDAIECMKSKSVEEIFSAVDKIGYTTQNIDSIKWSPIIDGDFLPAHPDELLSQSPVKPTLIGLSSKEGTYFTTMNLGRVLSTFAVTKEDCEKIDEKFVLNFIKNKILYNNRFGSKSDNALKKISEFYLRRNRPEHLEGNAFFLDAYAQLVSDIFFNVPVIRDIIRRVELNTPIWAYKFECFDDAIWHDHIPKSIRGSPHANEYHYLFDLPLIANIDTSKGKPKEIQENLIDMVVSFAKNGRPEIQNIRWNPVNNSDEINYLSFTQNGLTLNNGDYFEENTSFWNNLREDLGLDVVDPTSTRKNREKTEL
ncbi:unnamed protein product [Caenorhabditis bovis]|uniref:Carboxylic ester hydrolase n=1 Tax=Caenorhabditis bovis TaxID=2654633 RepID=A0A8S1EJN1_9PELO|nr:unnamed protein product [Caenorhabditis bovis]